jgi:hypothetical protein
VAGLSSLISSRLPYKFPRPPGNSETYRSPARRKFAATSDDPDGDKRFPLLSVRSLRPAS